MKITFTFILSTLVIILNAQSPGGVFEPGPQAMHQKIFPISTALNGNQVVSFGGRENGFISSSFTDLYDATGNSFSDAEMNGPHDGHAVVRLEDDEFLIIGGSYDLGVPAYANCEIYSAESGLFTDAGSMQYARMQCAGARLNDGKVLIAGGWYDNNPSAYPETYNPSTGEYILTEPLNTSRAQPIVIPTADGGAIIAGGWPTYGGSSYHSVEYYDAIENSFSVISEQILTDEEGWLLIPPSTRPISDCKLSNGHYVLMIYKPGTPNEYGLADFDPLTKEFTKINTDLPLVNEFTDGGFGNFVIDNVDNNVHLIGFDAGYIPQRLAVVSVDLSTGATYLPTSAFELPANEFFYASYTWLSEQGNIFVHGINASNTGYFDGTDKTYIITPSFSVGIGEKEKEESTTFSIYPNPATSNLVVRSDIDQIRSIRILSNTGQNVLTESYSTNQVQLDVSSLPSGWYMVEVSTENKVEHFKQLIQ